MNSQKFEAFCCKSAIALSLHPEDDAYSPCKQFLNPPTFHLKEEEKEGWGGGENFEKFIQGYKCKESKLNLLILCVQIETSSLWAEFSNKNRSVFVLYPRRLKALNFDYFDYSHKSFL
jgi:hypothetical protein